MRAPASVGVDDDLAAGQTGIALWPSNDEVPARIDVHNCVLVEVLLRDDGLDDLLHDFGAQFIERDLLRVLHRDDDRVDALWNASSVLENVFGSNLATRERRQCQRIVQCLSPAGNGRDDNSIS